MISMCCDSIYDAAPDHDLILYIIQADFKVSVR